MNENKHLSQVSMHNKYPDDISVPSLYTALVKDNIDYKLESSKSSHVYMEEVIQMPRFLTAPAIESLYWVDLWAGCA